ncbi:MAG: hypothetical protein J1E39_08565 [Eubacterium sp.]|nr:hypothetical protein [Eubacterium sp.]
MEKRTSKLSKTLPALLFAAVLLTSCEANPASDSTTSGGIVYTDSTAGDSTFNNSTETSAETSENTEPSIVEEVSEDETSKIEETSTPETDPPEEKEEPSVPSDEDIAAVSALISFDEPSAWYAFGDGGSRYYVFGENGKIITPETGKRTSVTYNYGSDGVLTLAAGEEEYSAVVTADGEAVVFTYSDGSTEKLTHITDDVKGFDVISDEDAKRKAAQYYISNLTFIVPMDQIDNVLTDNGDGTVTAELTVKETGETAAKLTFDRVTGDGTDINGNEININNLRK